MRAQKIIDKSGRVLIPKLLRDELHLEPGDTLDLEGAGEEIILRPVRGTGQLSEEHGVWILHAGQSLTASATGEMLRQIREERDLVNLSRQDG